MILTAKQDASRAVSNCALLSACPISACCRFPISAAVLAFTGNLLSVLLTPAMLRDWFSDRTSFKCSQPCVLLQQLQLYVIAANGLRALSVLHYTHVQSRQNVICFYSCNYCIYIGCKLANFCAKAGNVRNTARMSRCLSIG